MFEMIESEIFRLRNGENIPSAVLLKATSLMFPRAEFVVDDKLSKFVGKSWRNPAVGLQNNMRLVSLGEPAEFMRWNLELQLYKLSP